MSKRVQQAWLKVGQPCIIPGCGKAIRARGWCVSHWGRWHRYGDPLGESSRRASGTGTINHQGYIFHRRRTCNRSLHVEIAERAFGGPLPDGVKVHHGNGIKLDNRNDNLVICPNAAYHALLHARMRALATCGNADWRKCKHCKQWDAPENLKAFRGSRNIAHTQCLRDYAGTIRAKHRRPVVRKVSPHGREVIKALVAQGHPQNAIAQQFGIDQSYVSIIAHGRKRGR